MHSHVLNFRLDADILGGSKNNIEMHRVEPRQVQYPWSNNTRSTMALARETLKSEDDSKINFRHDTMYMISAEKNEYNETRGWRLMPGRGGGMHLVIQESDNLLNSMVSFTRDGNALLHT